MGAARSYNRFDQVRHSGNDPGACATAPLEVIAMSISTADKSFTGSIPKLYELHLVPMFFQPYATDLAQRLQRVRVDRLLELAAGTGVVTRALAASLGESVSIVATDLNQAMLDQGAAIGTRRSVEWRQADALALPFPDASFDAVVCQFGAMFFPDKPKAFAETHRVLRPGGLFLFNVWDRLDSNDFGRIVTEATATVFPKDPPRFFARVPHGYCDSAAIARDLAAGGFTNAPVVETVTARSRCASAIDAATGLCQGTPLRSEIEARDASRLGEATAATARAIAARFGQGAVDGKTQALVVAVHR